MNGKKNRKDSRTKGTLEKAIKTLTSSLKTRVPGFNLDEIDAIKLGIEALKRLKEHREEHIDISFRALPSETEN